MISDYHRYRIYEILPGLSIWLTLAVCVLLSFLKPVWMIYFIILFDVYWVLKVLNFSFYLVVAWRRYKKVSKIDWILKMKKETKDWQNKRHLVFLTLYDEKWSIVRTALEAVKASVYDPKKFIIIIAGEEAKKDNYEEVFQKINSEFRDSFSEIIGTLHPVGLEGEIRGKGSNLHYSEREVKKYIDKKGWKYKELIVTVFDIDTICHKQYFAYLTYLYCTNPNPVRSSYQPIALYNNNIWESPAILRLMAFGTTFWLLTSLAKQDSLVTFSSHSMSFEALVKAQFHDKRIVSEDSRIFYQCLLAYDGDYKVTPMYLPVSMDTVRDDKWWVSIKNLYKQQRRWAWGTEHVPYLLWEFRKKQNQFPLWKKIKWVFVEWEGKWSWCLVAVLITIIGRLPMRVAPELVRQSALYFNAPHILEKLMTVSMLGLLLSASLSFLLLPKRPLTHPKHTYIILLLQWILLPFSLIVVSALPAFDAVTHLMLGKYLGFNVSQKDRKALV